MNREQIAVCTTTRYDHYDPDAGDVVALCMEGNIRRAESNVRGRIALETLTAVLREGYQLILVDSSGPGTFQDALHERNIPFLSGVSPTMSGQRRQAYRAAFQDESLRAFVATEPEKTGLVSVLEQCVERVLDGTDAMTVIGRQEFVHYPTYQQRSETNAARNFNNLLHRARLLDEDTEVQDPFFAPRAVALHGRFRDSMREILLKKHLSASEKMNGHSVPLDFDQYLNATFLPIPRVLGEGLPMGSISIPFAYPEAQSALEQHLPFVHDQNGYRVKRAFQTKSILYGLAVYLRETGSLSIRQLQSLGEEN